MKVEGKIFNSEQMVFENGFLEIENGIIIKRGLCQDVPDQYILPGLVDAHVHIESSMVTPVRFAEVALTHGTVATVSDPHEIANVLGKKGVEFMVENGKKAPFYFYFGVPSCVPAAPYDFSGAVLGPQEVEDLLDSPDMWFLAEMMNFPGVLHDDPDVLRKINDAHRLNKPVDGHAPGLLGKDLDKYIKAGVQTDHEASSYQEGLEKIKKGMKLLIREGSAARNFDELAPLIDDFPDQVMLCCDDIHPDNLLSGHINLIIKKGIQRGIPVEKLIHTATTNPVKHYGLTNGLLRVNDSADFIVIDDLDEMIIANTFVNGVCVYEQGHDIHFEMESIAVNQFKCDLITLNEIEVPCNAQSVRAIGVREGDLFTDHLVHHYDKNYGRLAIDVDADVLKLVMVNRYQSMPPSVALVKNTGLKKGAMASSVAHDSHNIIAVGASEDDLLTVINLLIHGKGGLAAVSGDDQYFLPLPVAGIMADQKLSFVAQRYQMLDAVVKDWGSTLKAPFMALSFLGLIVIPELKIGPKGLFDVSLFDYISPCVD